MNDLARGQVRPTKKCLSDIGLTFPVLTRALSDLDHPVVRKSQSVPDEVAAGGAERILSLTDRVWFKAKVQSFRAAVTRLNDADWNDWNCFRFTANGGSALPDSVGPTAP